MPEPLDYERPGNPKVLALTGPVRTIVFGVIGVLLGIVICFLLWMIFGGWGPPAPLFFVGLGLVVGVVASFVEPAKRRRS